MASKVYKVSSISLSEGSGGSSVAKLETYDVKAENRPPSAARSARSTTCAGLCKGIGGNACCEVMLENEVPSKELTKRLRSMRTI